MAIRKRKNSWQVSYRVQGEPTPRTETYDTEEEATIRDLQIKLEKKRGAFVAPERIEKGLIRQRKNVTVEELMEEYIQLYGLKKWGNSVYANNSGMIKNYINPYIGKRYVKNITVKDMDAYYTALLDKPAVLLPGHTDTGAKVSASTVIRIHKLLQSAFGKAVAWGYMDSNPTVGATLPQHRAEKRAVWSDEEILRALSQCENATLKLCMTLAVGCSMRIGEILGLQWDRVHIEDDLVEAGEAYLEVRYVIARCSNDSIDALEQSRRSSIVLKFPHWVDRDTSTTLVMKEPKTESSVRTIFLPMAIVEELRKTKEQQEEYKRLLGDEYKDYGLVVAQPNGHPYEGKGINKLFKRMIAKHELRPVVFHSLRHTSTSLKLKLSKGNIKAVQGDTGHAEAKMVTDTYAHGFDADRKMIAKEMNDSFFSRIAGGQERVAAGGINAEMVKAFLQENPELLMEIQKGIG